VLVRDVVGLVLVSLHQGLWRQGITEERLHSPLEFWMLLCQTSILEIGVQPRTWACPSNCLGRFNMLYVIYALYLHYVCWIHQIYIWVWDWILFRGLHAFVWVVRHRSYSSDSSHRPLDTIHNKIINENGHRRKTDAQNYEFGNRNRRRSAVANTSPKKFRRVPLQFWILEKAWQKRCYSRWMFKLLQNDGMPLFKWIKLAIFSVLCASSQIL